MPELPEVETIRRQLDPAISGAVITDCVTFDHPKFTPAHLAVGRRVVSVGRRGKYLLVHLVPDGAATGSDAGNGEDLIVHLGMTGRLRVDADGRRATGADDEPYRRARWTLADGRSLVFTDVRRFGRIAVVPNGAPTGLATLDRMGPEPFDPAFDALALRSGVNASRRAIKTQLLSQQLVAGLGNIYADEALWAAGVHPAARRLTVARAERLAQAIRSVLSAGIEAGGTTLRDYRDANGDSGGFQFELHCYGRAGEPCDRCAAELVRTVIDARSTTFCRVCQRR